MGEDGDRPPIPFPNRGCAQCLRMDKARGSQDLIGEEMKSKEMAEAIEQEGPPKAAFAVLKRFVDRWDSARSRLTPESGLCFECVQRGIR
jgi:hypothetical protein